MALVTQSIEINASPKECFAVVSDYARYPEYLKESKEVKLDKRSGNVAEVTFSLELIKKISYTLKMVEKSPKSISWTLVRGEMMKSNRGSWTFEEIDKGLTKATYEIDIEFGLFVPGVISKMLIGSNLPGMLESVKKRVEGLGGMSQKKKK